MRQHRAGVWVVAVVLGLACVLPALGQKKETSPEPDKPKKPDAAQLARQLKEAQARIAELLKQVNQLRDKAVAAEIQAQSYKDKVNDLERQVKKLSVELARLKAGKGGKPAKTADNPPPEDVEGLVTGVKDGKIQLSIGSDAGLAKGHTLEVFRLGTTPKYLGRLRVIDVTATRAVCEVLGKKVDIKKGDRVASRMDRR
jgi:hypothetical protein